MGHDPETLPRVAIADEDGRPILRYSTDSPLRVTTGDLEALALYAGQGAALVGDIVPAAERLHRIMAEARVCLDRLRRIGG
jgi:nitronate monooxygenase